MASLDLGFHQQFGWPGTSGKPPLSHKYPKAHGLCKFLPNSNRRFVSLKLYSREEHKDNGKEYEICSQLQQPSEHLGREYVRGVLDTFTLPRDGGDHQCLVQTPLWWSLEELLAVLPNCEMNELMIKSVAEQLLVALDYLHTECKLVHTGTRGRYKYLKLRTLLTIR